MALSSVPIHLLYNSVVFSTLSAQDYSVFATSVGLVNGRPLNSTLLNDLGADYSYQFVDTVQIDNVQDQKNAPEWQKLDNKDCIKAYGQEFVSAHGDVLLILPPTNATGMIFLIMEVLGGFHGGHGWICGANFQPGCSTNAVSREAENWTLSYENGRVWLSNGSYEQFNKPIQCCLSQRIEEHCQVQISLVILEVVIACNAIKALCMLLTTRCQKSQPLVTLGDAIESFIQDPDRNTCGMCLASKGVIDNVGKNRINHTWLDGLQKPAWTPKPMKWTARRDWWFSSASLKRWLMCNIL